MLLTCTNTKSHSYVLLCKSWLDVDAWQIIVKPSNMYNHTFTYNLGIIYKIYIIPRSILDPKPNPFIVLIDNKFCSSYRTNLTSCKINSRLSNIIRRIEPMTLNISSFVVSKVNKSTFLQRNFTVSNYSFLEKKVITTSRVHG